MRSAIRIVLPSLLAVLCHAAVLDNVPAAGGSWFTLVEKQNSNYRAMSGLEEMLMTYLKYDVELTPALKKAMELNDELPLQLRSWVEKREGTNGTVKAYAPPVFDREFVVPVSIGTPPQEMHLNLDTGSADLWVFSTDTPSNLVNGQTLYKPNSSTTARLQDGQTWSVRYGDGSAAGGIVYADRFQVGETSFDSQMVQSATEVSDQHSKNSFASGIFGLSRSIGNSVRPKSALTYFDNIKSKLAAPVFSSNLQKGRPGNYDFGYINKTAYEGTLEYTEALPDTPYWLFTSGGFQIGSDKYTPTNWTSLADTGTTLWLLPGDITEQYWAQVPGAWFDARFAAIMFPCESELPSMAFGLGEYRGIVPSHYISHGRVNNTHCYGGIQSSEGLGLNIFGGTVLKAQFVVFDGERDKLGFANKPLVPE